MAAPITPRFILGNALALPLPDASVDLVVTSPPYFGLRDYNAGEHEVGSEATPAEFLDALVAATREMVRVLRPSGSIWVNLGDKYSTGNSGQSGLATWSEANARGGAHSEEDAKRASGRVAGLPPKSLLGLPWRYAIRCVDELGLVLREEVIWAKPNGLPESVKDRCARKHEQWFHFTVSPRYFAAMDLLREPHVAPGRQAGANSMAGRSTLRPNGPSDPSAANPLGKLPGSVWSVAAEPLPSKDIREAGHTAHFAAFPSEWPRRIVLGWCPPGGTVLDPFSGTGTTAIVASVLGCQGIGVDLNPEYIRLAQWRHEDGRLARKVRERTAQGHSPQSRIP
jgi:site-specific DNA-methyltransferase (cytosine-N4-specific)